MAGRPIPADIQKQIQQRFSVYYTDIKNPEIYNEIQEIITGAIDKAGSSPETVNTEAACEAIKKKLDQRFGTFWHCFIGEGFSFDVTAHNESILYGFYLGNLAVIVFKS